MVNRNLRKSRNQRNYRAKFNKGVNRSVRISYNPRGGIKL